MLFYAAFSKQHFIDLINYFGYSNMKEESQSTIYSTSIHENYWHRYMTRKSKVSFLSLTPRYRTNRNSYDTIMQQIVQHITET